MILRVRDLARLSWTVPLLVSPGIIHGVAVIRWLGWGWVNDKTVGLLVLAISWDCLHTASRLPGGQSRLLSLPVSGQQERERGSCKASGDLG